MAFAPLLIMSAISAGSTVAAAGMQAHAAGNAVKAQQKATDQGIAAQRANTARAENTLGAIYNQNRGNLKPWTDVGSSAINTLGSLTGTMRRPYTQQMPSGGSTLMQAPDGTQRPVPTDKVAFFQSKGATIVPQAQAPAGVQ